jgi:hypothetical protein
MRLSLKSTNRGVTWLFCQLIRSKSLWSVKCQTWHQQVAT